MRGERGKRNERGKGGVSIKQEEEMWVRIVWKAEDDVVANADRDDIPFQESVSISDAEKPACDNDDESDGGGRITSEDGAAFEVDGDKWWALGAAACPVNSKVTPSPLPRLSHPSHAVYSPPYLHSCPPNSSPAPLCVVFPALYSLIASLPVGDSVRFRSGLQDQQHQQAGGDRLRLPRGVVPQDGVLRGQAG